MQTAGDLVAVSAELAAGMEHGEHNLEGGDLELGVLVDGDAATVVFDRAGAVFVDGHVDLVAKPAESLVDGVVDDLPDEVMKEPMYMPGRLRTASRPSSTWMSFPE